MILFAHSTKVCLTWGIVFFFSTSLTKSNFHERSPWELTFLAVYLRVRVHHQRASERERKSWNFIHIDYIYNRSILIFLTLKCNYMYRNFLLCKSWYLVQGYIKYTASAKLWKLIKTIFVFFFLFKTQLPRRCLTSKMLKLHLARE